MRQKGEDTLMCDSTKLKAKMVEKGFTQEKLASHIGINKSTLNRKIKNLDDFSIGEAKKIARILELSGDEATVIFFANYVA